MKFPQSTSKRSALGRNLVQLLSRPAVSAALRVLALDLYGLHAGGA